MPQSTLSHRSLTTPRPRLHFVCADMIELAATGDSDTAVIAMGQREAAVDNPIVESDEAAEPAAMETAAPLKVRW